MSYMRLSNVKNKYSYKYFTIENYEEQAVHGSSLESQPSAHFYQPPGNSNH